MNDILLISAAHHPKYIGIKVDILNYIPEIYDNILCCAEVMVLRVNPAKIDPYYVYLFLKTREGYKAIQSCIRGQTAHIYPKDIREIEIPILPQEKYDNLRNELEVIKTLLLVKEESEVKLTNSVLKLTNFIEKLG